MGVFCCFPQIKMERKIRGCGRTQAYNYHEKVTCRMSPKKKWRLYKEEDGLEGVQGCRLHGLFGSVFAADGSNRC